MDRSMNLMIAYSVIIKQVKYLCEIVRKAMKSKTENNTNPLC